MGCCNHRCIKVAPKREAKFIILGSPIAWARPGKTRYSNAAFDTQKAIKEEYRWHLKASHGSDKPFSGPLHIDFMFYMPMTKTATKAHSERIGDWHIFKPDSTNLMKLIEDAASSDILFHDDCTVAKISEEKIWAEVARTEITISELPPRKIYYGLD